MAEALTEEQTEQCEIFKLFANECGHITNEQLGEVMRYLGVNPTKAELSAMIKDLGSKEIDREKFLELMAKQKQVEENIKEELTETFKIFDKGTGTVSRQELRHVLTTIGEPLTEDEIEEMIKEADTSQDGKLVIEDFIKLLLAK
uniref:EF-hand domain-containing protein n=1 Tax=Arcella intermedia TaxID=1963864 RepID=A0A6B2LPD5_9EUKA|eukprot:TRINITY_DN4336_c0_g1_i2.p1 TRINITY_DN4336_c0_g1~~TRINITY_DN4336_c0_g1_i2.p1  ORF type:complete len:153 (-),score=28.78 TRINITY_DN4336_c0_g1_i2:26-460(-)